MKPPAIASPPHKQRS